MVGFLASWESRHRYTGGTEASARAVQYVSEKWADFASVLGGLLQGSSTGGARTVGQLRVPCYAVYAWRRIERTLSRSITTAKAPRTASSNRISAKPPPASMTLRSAALA